MHIAEIAPLAESVPPSHYGGTERVVSWLTDELVGLGDKVTLFASGGSKTKAELVPISPKPLRLSRPPIDPTSALTAMLECVARRADEFDVIHCHLDWISHSAVSPARPAVRHHAAGSARSAAYAFICRRLCRCAIYLDLE
jgi:glycosyltransferase involved in cell wall biosynthesis